MLDIQNITKKYKKGPIVYTAIDDVSFKVKKNDFFAVIGASGSGKSTLLNSVGGLIHPDTGKILYNNNDIYKLNRKASDRFRKEKIGFVFQQFHLLPYLTVEDNISMACFEKSHYENIDPMLEKCSLTELKKKYPSELSVGEKQRTAFIRAIISKPEILLADEPTGNLDPQNSKVLLDLIEDFHKNGGTVLLVSHDSTASGYATETIRLEKGKLT
jgi:putative ABC transport system ATP-binding protein